MKIFTPALNTTITKDIVRHSKANSMKTRLDYKNYYFIILDNFSGAPPSSEERIGAQTFLQRPQDPGGPMVYKKSVLGLQSLGL